MKIDIMDNKIIIFLKKEIISDIDFDNIEMLEEYFRELILKLNNVYNINIEGFYIIRVFIDSIYGIVLEIEPEDIDYCPINQVEMRIMLEHETFLYEIDSLVKIDNTEIYIKDYKYYLKINSNIKYKDYISILENCHIIYKNTSNIIKRGNIINYFNLSQNMI